MLLSKIQTFSSFGLSVEPSRFVNWPSSVLVLQTPSRFAKGQFPADRWELRASFTSLIFGDFFFDLNNSFAETVRRIPRNSWNVFKFHIFLLLKKLQDILSLSFLICSLYGYIFQSLKIRSFIVLLWVSETYCFLLSLWKNWFL